MELTSDDLQSISTLLDQKLDEKLQKLNDFADFAEPAIEALMEESQENFNLKLKKRVEDLEKIHPLGKHLILVQP